MSLQQMCCIHPTSKENDLQYIPHQNNCINAGKCRNCNENIKDNRLHEVHCLYYTEFHCPTPEICFNGSFLIHKCSNKFNPVILNLPEDILRIEKRNIKVIDLSIVAMIGLLSASTRGKNWKLKLGLYLLGIRVGLFVFEIINNPLTIDKYRIAWKLYRRLPLLPFSFTK